MNQNQKSLERGDTKMFEKIKSIIANFVSQYESLKTTFENEVARIKATYIEGNSQFVNEMRIAKDTFEHGVQALRDSSFEQVNGVIQELNSTLAQMVTSDVSPNVIAELELLKTVNLTQYEVDNFLKKYATNYLATKSMKEIAQSKGLETDNVMCADDFKEMIQEVFADCQLLFNTYTGKHESYKCELVINGAKFDRFSEQFKSFLQVEGEK